MKKKLTLRLLTAVLMIMTAVAFIPMAADTVWAEEVSDRTNKTPWEIDIGCGPVTITAGKLTYYTCVTKNEGTPNEYDIISPMEEKITNMNVWYGTYQIVISGTTSKTYKIPKFRDSKGDPLPESYDSSGTLLYDEVTYGPNSISISGETHYITFDNVTMTPESGSTTPYPAVYMSDSAVAEITISGNNTITSYDAPGISVPYGAALTLRGATADNSANVLNVSATCESSSNAGIGGKAFPGDCGNITIGSGTVNATGSKGGAGIGGSTAGSGNITITGGVIRAKGGDDVDSTTGAPGIGSGSSCSGGSVTISGGKITALGGKGSAGTAASAAKGIVGEHLSTKGNTLVLSSTGGILRSPASTESKDVFNAIVWEDENNATVYGDVLISKEGGTTSDGKTTYQSLIMSEDDTLLIPDGTSATVLDEGGTAYNFNKATLTGGGYLIGTFDGHTQLKDTEPKLSISLATGIQEGNKNKYIHIIGKDIGHYAIYDGEPKELLEDLIIIDEKTNTSPSRWLDIDNWDKVVYGSNGEVSLDNIVNAGPYRIRFIHKQNAYTPFEIHGAEISSKDLTEYMIDMEDTFSYGEKIQYSVIDDDISDDKKATLQEGVDYKVTFYQYDEDDNMVGPIANSDKITDVGSYAAVFEGIGNYTTEEEDNEDDEYDGKLIFDFDIEAASIKNAKVTVKDSKNFIYNGQAMFKPTGSQLSKNVTITLNEHTIPISDCEVIFNNSSLTPESEEYSNQEKHLTYAGTVTVTITPTSDNYSDYVISTFEIGKRPVSIARATAAYDVNGKLVSRRTYDGTNIVNIVSSELQESKGKTSKEGVISTDEDYVYIDIDGLEEDKTDNLKGTLDGADVIPSPYYEYVTIADARLAGDRSSNYKVVESRAKLEPTFEITRLAVPFPDIEISSKTSSGNKEQFLCTVNVTNAPNDGAMYLYGISEEEDNIDNVQWQNSNQFDKLKSNTTYWFYCKVDDTPNSKAAQNTYPDPKGIASKSYKTPLIPQDPPNEFELEITLDPNGETYTVTIPEQEGAQYSFDGKNYGKSNVLKRVGANETVTGYARFPATKTHATSKEVSATDVTPPLTVKTPVISPENGAFYGSVKVEISCGTAGATIYYTTDGNYPVAGRDPVYRSPITVTENTTISAIAVKNDMEESELASVDYVYTEFPPTSKSNVTRGVKVTNDLKNSPSFSQKDSITAALSKAITEDGDGYTYQNIAFYDLQIQLCFDGSDKNFVKANADNFPEEGVEITVPVPKDTSTSTHEFRVAHMFSETSDRLGITAGEIEKPEPTENGEGITFTVTGCSPLAIGWVETEDGAATGDDENKDEDANASAGDEADTLNANGQTGNANGDAENAAGGANADGANADGAGGANADGTGADGENAENAEDADGADDASGVVDELVNAVTTGDYTNPYFWAAVAIVSLLFIIIIAAATRRRRT